MDEGQRNRLASLFHLSEKPGFEQVSKDDGKISIWGQLHRRGENMLALLFVMAVNPASARLDVLRLDRALVFMSKNRLLQLCGPGRRKSRAPARQSAILPALSRLGERTIALPGRPF